MAKARRILYLILFSLVVRISLYFVQTHPIWWDTAVYSSMGKYIFSLGKAGLWEPVRPLVFPLLMGFVSVFPAKIVLAWGFFLELVFTAGVLYLTYLIGRRIFGENVGLFASFLLSFTPFFFFFGYIPLSDIPSTFFALLALLFFIEKKDIASGVLIAIAVMTRFPQGLVLISMLLLCFSLRRIARIGTAFIFTLAPFLGLNFVMYGNPVFPFVEGSGVIAEAGLWLFQGGWYYYAAEILKDNILYLFALVGFVFLRKKDHFILAVPLLVLLAYFSLIQHKELRFAIVFLPYLAMLTSYGCSKLILYKKAFFIFIVLAFAIFVYSIRLEKSTAQEAAMPFYQYLEKEEIDGEILTSNPIVGIYTNAKLKLLYYPVFDAEKASYWAGYADSHKDVVYIFIDTCNGLLCPPKDSYCIKARKALEGSLKEKYKEVFFKEGESCYYKIFKQ